MKNIRFFIALSILMSMHNQLHGSCVFRSRNGKRTAYNSAQLRAFKDNVNNKPKAHVAIVSDLHDVVFDRLSGDIARARQLSWSQWDTLIRHLPIFAIQYGLHKMHLAKHPCLEQYLAQTLTDSKNNALMQLISPFKLNKNMMELYQNAHYPVFACSNCGEYSYQFLTQELATPLFKGIQIATAANKYMQKDLPETYRTLYDTMTQYMKHEPDIVLMIDDKQENIDRCRSALKEKCSVYGFIFKNFEDLQQTLRAHNITL